MTDAPLNPPHIRKVRTSLQRQMARPGGRLVSEALSRAQKGLEAQRAQTLRILQANVQALADLCAARPAQAGGEVYALSSAMVDMAGFLDMPAFFDAAYSLCEVADRMSAAGIWSWPSVEVHVRALNLILADEGRSTEATEELLAGLRAVVAHAPAVR